MLKILFITLTVLLSTFSGGTKDHYENETWEVLLNDVKMKYRFSVDRNGFLEVPKFGSTVEALEGEEITIQGFFLPVEITGSAFVISHAPMQMCFFCAGSGIESVVELRSLPSHQIYFRRLKTDDFVKVKGKLKLNRNDPDHLIYILEDAQFVDKVK